MSRSSQDVLREVREEWGARDVEAIDWKTVDPSLFDRIYRERRNQVARFTNARSRRWGLACAGVLAVAAALLLTLGKGDVPPETRANGHESVGVVSAVEGRVLVNRGAAGRGTAVRLGDVIEAGGRVTIEWPGVTGVLERDSSVTVTHTHGPLVLALERGVVEASVVPVSAGEAFAVDVEHSRIAAHGTHLRVARAGSRAVVDLTEGVVSLGQAPRVGPVLGTVIVAPAHAEFAVADAQGTLNVTHDAAAVRSPAAFAAMEPASLSRTVPALEPKVDSISTRASSPPFSTRAESRPASPAPTPIPSEADTTAAIASAVRACMADRPPAENVTVVVQTTLYVALQDDGTVRSARFEPPLMPDVNDCATPAIYKARFVHGGSASLVLSYVSR